MFMAVVALQQVRAKASLAPEDHIPVVLTLRQFEQLQRLALDHAADHARATRRHAEVTTLLTTVARQAERG